MNSAEFHALPDSEKQHFYRCEKCGQMVDMRHLDDVLFHEDHVSRVGHSVWRFAKARRIVELITRAAFKARLRSSAISTRVYFHHTVMNIVAS
jgi:hypothetical protein